MNFMITTDYVIFFILALISIGNPPNITGSYNQIKNEESNSNPINI